MISPLAVPTAKRNLWRIYALEARYEFLKQLRLPAYVVPTLAFPLVFYLLFGVALNHGAGVSTYMLATYGAFGVMNTALFAFGVGVAAERGQGWMLFKRATPMPPFAHFAGKLAMSERLAKRMHVDIGSTLVFSAQDRRIPVTVAALFVSDGEHVYGRSEFILSQPSLTHLPVVWYGAVHVVSGT